jgi:hypothetical protein
LAIRLTLLPRISILAVLIIFVFSTPVYSDDKELNFTKDLAKKVIDDDLFWDLFVLQLEREQRKIQKNSMLLNYIEEQLLLCINTGRVDEEKCIREGISQLRTIKYVYQWADIQLKNMKDKSIRYSIFNDLERIRYLNKMFSDTYLSIEECRIKSTRDQDFKTELLKDINENRIEAVKKEITIKEENKAAIVPFR